MITIRQLCKPGQRVRVKRTDLTKEFGIRCRGAWDGGDRKLWPGEIGEVKESVVKGLDWEQAELIAEFSRGRKLTLATLYEADRETYCSDPQKPGAVWVLEGQDLQNLLIHKDPKNAKAS